MRTALRTALATALVAGVVITPAVTAGAAFADEAKAGATVTSPDTPSAPAHTVKLDGGLTAQVQRHGEQHAYYTAAVSKDGKELGTLKAGAGHAEKETKVFGDYAVTLDSTGKVTSLQDKGSNGQGRVTPVGDSLGKHKLADGTTGELWRKAKGWYTLELRTAEGKPRGSVTAGGPEGAAEKGAQFGEMWVTLDNTGRIGSWLNRNLGTDYSDSREGCTVTRNSGSAFDELSLQLVNSPSGHFARVLEGDKVLETLNERNSVGLAGGVWMTEPPGGLPGVQMRTMDSPRDFFTLAFPALPKGCGDAPVPGPPVKTGECTVTQVIPSVFGHGMTVTLTNDLAKGPNAVLKDMNGRTLGTVDRANLVDTDDGLRIKDANTLTPVLGQRTQGSDAPYEYTDFPALPESCDDKETEPTTQPTTGTTGSTGNQQTTVVPQGGVAAGAELGTANDGTALLAAGAGAASLAAAGLGFLVLRRRSAAAARV